MAMPTLNNAIETATIGTVNEYLEGCIRADIEPSNLLRRVYDEAEKPLLDIAMKFTHGNQSRAAVILGVNRATLRTKLKRHGMI